MRLSLVIEPIEALESFQSKSHRNASTEQSYSRYSNYPKHFSWMKSQYSHSSILKALRETFFLGRRGRGKVGARSSVEVSTERVRSYLFTNYSGKGRVTHLFRKFKKRGHRSWDPQRLNAKWDVEPKKGMLNINLCFELNLNRLIELKCIY